jgi:hypothetical protein
MSWTFKEVLHINKDGKKETIKKDDRKFEFLIKDYLDRTYPLEHWELTKASRDGNRDIESVCSFSGKSMWAEVKYLYKNNRNLSSRRYDSTLVSAELNQTVIQIFFVANTDFGPNIRYRIKEFCFLNNIQKIVFIDKDTLEYWIKSNPIIEKKYFAKPIVLQNTTPFIHLEDICILHLRDSYSCDSILSGQKIIGLYDYSNYRFEAEIFVRGLENHKIEIRCNKEVLYSDISHSGYITINFNTVVKKHILRGENKIAFCFEARYNDNIVVLDTIILEFSMQDYFFKSQFNCYKTISYNIRNNRQIIFNIFGAELTGKSWVLDKIKCDLLRDKKNKVIYVKFWGDSSDILQICRMFLLLIFDFDSLSININHINKLIDNLETSISKISTEIIAKLVEALKNNDSDTILNIFKGCINVYSDHLFECRDYFDYSKFFLIDNLYKLSKDATVIFNVILNSFRPFKKITFIITSHESIKSSYIENIKIDFIHDDELLSIINENITEHCDDLSCMIPNNHKLIYPNIVNEFISNLQHIDTSNQVSELYANIFKEKINYLFEIELRTSDIIEILIYMIGEGVPIQFILKYKTFDWINKKMQSGYIQLDNGFVYPDSKHTIFDINSYVIPQSDIINLFEDLIKFDDKEKNKYILALVKYFPELLLGYFDYFVLEVEKSYNSNQYSIIIKIGELLYQYLDIISADISKKILIKYFYGFALMHCGSSQKALEIFYDIRKQYQHLKKDKIYFDSYSEIIDAEYWRMITPQNQYIYINNFRKEWKFYNEGKNYRSYLTATNRFMVQALLQDDIQLANRWQHKNLKLAALYNSSEHIGYTFMDYAKGIYHLDLNKALYYLEIAQKIFEKAQNEKRRFFDCQCEIAYVKLLLGKGSISELENASINLFKNCFWKQYYKSRLKLAGCQIVIFQSKKEAQKLIVEIQNSHIAQSSIRVQYLSGILKLFCNESSCHSINLQLKRTSYNIIINHNHTANKNKAIFFKMGANSPYYYVDPRIW